MLYDSYFRAVPVLLSVVRIYVMEGTWQALVFEEQHVDASY